LKIVQQAYLFLPYCGAPPTPDTLLGRWNLDPVLLGCLAAILAGYILGRRAPAKPQRPWRRLAFGLGWALGTLALVSPLCPLSVALFSARVGQHMVLVALVAPLIALGRPDAVVSGWLGRTGVARQPRPVAAAAALAGALWLWHAPAFYTATFQSDLTYWAMHLTTFGAALWFWTELLGSSDGRLGGFALATVMTTGQMGLLGALITFAVEPLYPPHASTTYAWGLTPLQDQQLGGVLMWIPAGVIFAGGLALAFSQMLQRPDARSPAQASA
jgi:putative membrane protein